MYQHRKNKNTPRVYSTIEIMEASDIQLLVMLGSTIHMPSVKAIMQEQFERLADESANLYETQFSRECEIIQRFGKRYSTAAYRS